LATFTLSHENAQAHLVSLGAYLVSCLKPDRALVAPSAMPCSMPATPISRKGVFRVPFVASGAYVASAISCLVCLEVVEALRSAFRQRSSVTVMRIKAVVDMAEKAVWSVKPGASSKKHPANKPIGPVIAIRSTVIGCIVEVPVRTHGSRSDVDADGNLGWRHRRTA
jgi:hypothetical protein